MPRTLVAFGFGPIGAELFLGEAYRSGQFDELFVSEVDGPVVGAIRANNGNYTVNVATLEKRVSREVRGVRLCNPNDPSHRAELVAALRRADEIVTALPKVGLYSSIIELLAEGLMGNEKPVVVYTAENDNHAAEKLEQALEPVLPQHPNVVFLNTVIGKMSQKVDEKTSPGVIKEMNLSHVAPGLSTAFLVEETPYILLCRSMLPPTHRTGLSIFQEKPDLFPFEEAKLYGHNAVHALMGYLLAISGFDYMHKARFDTNKDIMAVSRAAFIQESGNPLIKKYDGLDRLFTESGYTEYVADLMDRMSNPWLNDQVARVIRDPKRKLEYDDRLIGTIRLARSQKLKAPLMTLGAAAALIYMGVTSSEQVVDSLTDIWREKTEMLPDEAYDIAKDVQKAHIHLTEWLRAGKPYLVDFLANRHYVSPALIQQS